jgi:hypothetical protein
MNGHRTFRPESLESMDELHEFAPPRPILNRHDPVDLYVSSLKSLFESGIPTDDLTDSYADSFAYSPSTEDHNYDRRDSVKDLAHLMDDLLRSRSTFTLSEDVSMEREMRRLQKIRKDLDASGNTFASFRRNSYGKRNGAFESRRGSFGTNESLGDVFAKKGQLNEALKDVLPAEFKKRQQYIDQKHKMLGLLHTALVPPQRRASRSSSNDSYMSSIRNLSLTSHSTGSGSHMSSGVERSLSPITVDSTFDNVHESTSSLVSWNESRSRLMPRLSDGQLESLRRPPMSPHREMVCSSTPPSIHDTNNTHHPPVPQDAPPKMPKRAASVLVSERLCI